MKFKVSQLTQSAILYLYSKRPSIWIDPPYQRTGDVWPREKKQLLVDSIINDFDIPKIYFHDLEESHKKYEFAIIDGRQRLEAIWQFIDGDFPLSDDFEYLRNKKIKPKNLTYSELAAQYPDIKQLFDAKSLSVFVVQTDDLDLIEDMFSRLNEAVPLNAAEKRNAFGGPLPKLSQKIASLPFFAKNLKISNKRYQHRDLSAKMLYLTHNDDAVVDTKKVYLDAFFRNNRAKTESAFRTTTRRTKTVLATMNKTFVEKDTLLRSSGMVILYYLLFSKAEHASWRRKLSRSRLLEFESLREKNRSKAEEDITQADYELLEFDRLTQTPNDAYAIRYRLGILEKFVQR